jgi:hypothetical protein
LLHSAPAPGGDDGEGDGQGDNIIEDDFVPMEQNFSQMMVAGGGGPPDGDGSDGSEDDDEEEEGEEEESDDGSDAESNVMVVLEPDHVRKISLPTFYFYHLFHINELMVIWSIYTFAILYNYYFLYFPVYKCKVSEQNFSHGNHIVNLFLFQPLMKRFQAALKKQLTKQNEKVTLELRELVSKKLNVINYKINVF